MYLKKCILIITLLIYSAIPIFADETIRAQNNAYRHNNKGLLYLDEKYYFGAIKEFEIAIALNPNSQASATYYVNLASTYEKIGYYDLAKPYYEKAVSLCPLYFDYYLKLTNNYKKLGIVDKKIKEYQKKTYNPLNEVIIGLLYIQKGEKNTGVTILDDFINKEEKLIISKGVKNYLQEITK